MQTRAMRHWLRWLGGASEGAQALEFAGVTASLVPAVPERSVANGVAFESAPALTTAYDELAAAYDDAGIRAWTVWAPEHDAEAIALLEGRGHVLDGEPAAMVLELDSFAAPPPGDLDWDSAATPAELGEVNDLAYGHPGPGGIAAGFGPAADELGMRFYRARLGGRLACVLVTGDAEDDVGVYFVATLPEHQGHGLATRLMGVALGEASERGLATSSLQASAAGEPVYAALGYRSCFRLRMYERRR